jgi:hypothetical protein
VESQASTQASARSYLESPTSLTEDASDEDFILTNIKKASMEELVANIPSCVPLSVRLIEPTWFAPPLCVGALSCLRLAEVLSNIKEIDASVIQAVVQGAGIEKALVSLGSNYQDKREAAGLLLEQISILREPILMSKLVSDKALLVFSIRLTEEEEELRNCVSNIIYQISSDNTKVKTHIAGFQGGRILQTMIDILGTFIKFDLMMMHAARLREFYLDQHGQVNQVLLNYLKVRGLEERLSQAAAALEYETSASEELRSLIAQMKEEATGLN